MLHVLQEAIDRVQSSGEREMPRSRKSENVGAPPLISHSLRWLSAQGLRGNPKP